MSHRTFIGRDGLAHTVGEKWWESEPVSVVALCCVSLQECPCQQNIDDREARVTTSEERQVNCLRCLLATAGRGAAP